MQNFLIIVTLLTLIIHVIIILHVHHHCYLKSANKANKALVGKLLKEWNTQVYLKFKKKKSFNMIYKQKMNNQLEQKDFLYLSLFLIYLKLPTYKLWIIHLQLLFYSHFYSLTHSQLQLLSRNTFTIRNFCANQISFIILFKKIFVHKNIFKENSIHMV